MTIKKKDILFEECPAAIRKNSSIYLKKSGTVLSLCLVSSNRRTVYEKRFAADHDSDLPCICLDYEDWVADLRKINGRYPLDFDWNQAGILLITSKGNVSDDKIQYNTEYPKIHREVLREVKGLCWLDNLPHLMGTSWETLKVPVIYQGKIWGVSSNAFLFIKVQESSRAMSMTKTVAKMLKFGWKSAGMFENLLVLNNDTSTLQTTCTEIESVAALPSVITRQHSGNIGKKLNASQVDLITLCKQLEGFPQDSCVLWTETGIHVQKQHFDLAVDGLAGIEAIIPLGLLRHFLSLNEELEVQVVWQDKGLLHLVLNDAHVIVRGKRV